MKNSLGARLGAALLLRVLTRFIIGVLNNQVHVCHYQVLVVDLRNIVYPNYRCIR